MKFTDKVRRLERAAKEDMIVVPQLDGPVRRFPASASRDAYVNLFERMGAGEDALPEHLLLAAIGTSSDEWWLGSAYLVDDPDEWIKPIEDLSEP
jgi:hypothetical protein